MKVMEYGQEHPEVIVLLHGGGLSWWNYREAAQRLKERYHVVIPVLDGHGGSDRPFTSIEENAREIISWVDENCRGHVLLMGGLSLGGQILLEVLAQRGDICQYAVVESALTLPMKLTAVLVGPSFRLCYPLIRRRWFARLQFRSLRIKEELFEEYFADTAAIAREDMVAFLKANADYRLKDVASCAAKALVLVGEKEQAVMKKSAEEITKTLPNAQLETLPGLYHGEISINHAGQYVEKLLRLMGLRQE
ncbi:MAG: alpha/beta hydrolase [Clostridia bacterium]|nr:alpha/beta hydrolase [Clostridia bacterium]